MSESYSKYKTSFRTHNCNELNISHENKKVKLSGWVNSKRDHGGLIFIDLRDRYGITQIVINPEEKTSFEIANKCRPEDVISISGIVKKRIAEPNPRLATGDIEVIVDHAEILNPSKTPPFEIDKSENVNENMRLKYRYLDLRNKKIQKILKFRHKLIEYTRQFFYEKDFIEIQTPLLTNSTPEGARDFLVPARYEPGKFFALPQSPQQYKQLLMISGYDRYFQVAPCLRDEDPRSDRLYGDHYQFDLEMSFVDQNDIMEIISEYYTKMTADLSEKKIKSWKNENENENKNFKLLKSGLPVFKYEYMINTYASDKPDLRLKKDIKIFDVKSIFEKTDFKAFKNSKTVRTIVAPDGGEKLSRKFIENYQKMVQEMGASGLAYVKVSDKKLESGISKFIPENFQKEIIEKTKTKSGDLLFFMADDDFERSNVYLDKVRRRLSKDLDLIDENLLAFAWVVDFPFFELDEKGWTDFEVAHNPFSKPALKYEEIRKLFDEYKKTKSEKIKNQILEIKATQYDFICNGYELFSGGERNYDKNILKLVFEVLGYSDEEIKSKFGHMIEAFEYGAPPTAGAGIGLERTLMVLTDEDNVRNLMAFPKASNGTDPMFESPSHAKPEQLKELGLKF